MTRTLSVAIKENTYQDLKQKVGNGKISSFVNHAVEKELKELVHEQQKEKEQLKRRLVAAHKRIAKNEKLKKELRCLEEASLKDVFTKLDKAEKRNE